MQSDLRFGKVVQQVLDQLPADADIVRQDIKKCLSATLQSTLSKLEIVSREDFDIQSQLLSRTRTLVEELEKKVSILEQNRYSQTQ